MDFKKSLLKTSLVGIILAFVNIASADVIKCTFTEPFLQTEYNTTRVTFAVVDPVSKYPKKLTKIYRGHTLQIKGPGIFEVVSEDQKVVQVLNLNFKGSNGMSDTVYPYSVEWTDATGRKLVGGCESNYLKSTEPGENH